MTTIIVWAVGTVIVGAIVFVVAGIAGERNDRD